MYDQNTDQHTDHQTPAARAEAAVRAQLDALDAGPDRVAHALDELRAAVDDYTAAHATLAPFGLVGGHKRPHTLPGARAIAAVTRKPRRRK